MKSSDESISGQDFPKPPDRNFSWVIMFSTAFIDCLYRGLMRSFGILFKEMRQEFNTNNTTITVLLGLTNSVGKFIGPFIGLLTTSTSCRLAVFIGGLTISSGLFLTFFVHTVEYAFFTIGILLGSGIVFCEFANKIILSQYFKKRITIAHGVRNAGASIGGMILPISIHFILNIYHIQGTFLLLSGLMLHILIFGSLFYPLPWTKHNIKYNLEKLSDIQGKKKLLENTTNITDIKNQNDIISEEQEESLKSSDETVTIVIFNSCPQKLNQIQFDKDLNKNKKSIRKISKKITENCCTRFLIDKCKLKLCINWQFIMYTLVTSLIPPASSNFFTILPVYAEESQIEKKDAAILLTILGILDLVGRLLCGWFVDLFRLKKQRCYVILCTLSGVTIYTFPFLKQFHTFAIMCALFGIVHGCLVPLLSALLVDVFGAVQLPMVLGLQYPFNGIAAIMFPFLIGFLADYYGHFQASLFVLGSTFLLVAIVMCLSTPGTYFCEEKKQSKKGHDPV